jgi:hypothetical protein
LSGGLFGLGQVTYATAETVTEKLARLKIASTAVASILSVFDFLDKIGVIDQDIPNPARALSDPEFAAVTIFGGTQGIILGVGIASTASSSGPVGLAIIISGGSGLSLGRGLDVGSGVVFGTTLSELLSRGICSIDTDCL